jgi:hypothetical protein
MSFLFVFLTIKTGREFPNLGFVFAIERMNSAGSPLATGASQFQMTDQANLNINSMTVILLSLQAEAAVVCLGPPFLAMHLVRVVLP